MSAIFFCYIGDEGRPASRGQTKAASELGEARYHSRVSAIYGEFNFFYCICVCPFFFFLEDAHSPVPVSENKTDREGSLLMIGGELRADQVRNVSCI